jgi:threonine/homoserine/homoserine lactone efflux protein
LHLAWKLWSAPAKRVEVADSGREHGWRTSSRSLLLTLANPKTILFFLALLPTVIDLASMNLVRFVESPPPCASYCRGSTGRVRGPGRTRT